MNEVNFYEPFMEEPAILPGRPLSEMDIVEFVNQHRRSSCVTLFKKAFVTAIKTMLKHFAGSRSSQGNSEEAPGREHV